MAFALLLLALLGCSRDGRVSAGGTVTLDGKPLESGVITFQPAPGSEGVGAGGQLAGGQFQIAAKHGLKPGKYWVSVKVFRPTGRMVEDPLMHKKIPETALVKYNEAGKLETTVAADAANHFEFQLTSADGSAR
jgi:hypothetical protein